MDIESTATRIFDSGNGYRARVVKPGYMNGYRVTVDNNGRVWCSAGLSHLTAADCERETE